MHTLIYFFPGVISVTDNNKGHICKTTHGIKTDKIDAPVANVCIVFRSGGWQAVYQLNMIGPRR